MRNFAKSLVILTFISLLFCACSSNNQAIEGKQQAAEIMRCFQEKDIDGLKNLFCKSNKATHDLNSEIEDAMKFIDGEIISYDDFSISSGDAVDNGILTDSHISIVIKNIRTDIGNTYKITSLAYLTYEKNEDFVGITQITIRKESDEIYTIGEYLY